MRHLPRNGFKIRSKSAPARDLISSTIRNLYLFAFLALAATTQNQLTAAQAPEPAKREPPLSLGQIQWNGTEAAAAVKRPQEASRATNTTAKAGSASEVAGDSTTLAAAATAVATTATAQLGRLRVSDPDTTTTDGAGPANATLADVITESSAREHVVVEDDDPPGLEEEDVVISSSEILNDNDRGFMKPPARNKKTKYGPPNNSNCSESGPDSGGRLREFGAEAAAGQTDDQQQQHNNIISRLLLQMMVIGLFGLVSLSLVVVYAIKFCICRRRKRFIQRNMVADIAPPRSTGPQCTCPIPQPLLPPPMLNSLQHDVGSNHHRLFSRRTTNARFWHAIFSDTNRRAQHSPLSATDLYARQLAMAEHLRSLHHSAATHDCATCQNQQSIPPASCLCVPPSIQQQQQQQQQQIPATRPPPYSELFGQHPNAFIQSPDDGVPSQQPPSASSEPSPDNHSSSSTSEATTATQDSHSPLSGSQQAAGQQRNLLVKLNLNKTKLLSADDLVLLSKLIDVPIVVQQQQQHHHHQHEQQPLAVRDESGGDTSQGTLIEEIEEPVDDLAPTGLTFTRNIHDQP